MNNKKVIYSLLLLCLIVFILGMHGGSEYYFRDFCVHKTLNMFLNWGNPEFFKKPNLVSDIQAIGYGFYYIVLKQFHVVSSFPEFVNYFSQNYIPTPIGNISFMLPALIINNIFAAMGVCFTFLITYLLTDKRILPSFISAFILATSYSWMNFSHHLAVDIPLTALCLSVLFFTMYFVQNKPSYSNKEIIFLGILSGLCFSAKYNGLLVIVAPLSILALTKTNKKDFILKILLLFVCAIYTFFITNPYIITEFNHFYNDFLFEYLHAFKFGHNSADDSYSFLFHIFHSFPNSLGTLVFICSIIGGILFCCNKQIPLRMKYPMLSFIVIFCCVLSCSFLVFQRYILPIIPCLAIFVGYLINYAIIKSQKSMLLKVLVSIGSVALVFSNFGNAVHFYKLMSYEDTRVAIKKVFKTLNVDKQTKVSYSDIFSNPYYTEDFTNEFPNLKFPINEYLYKANNSSIYILPRPSSNMFYLNQIIIFDSFTYDRTIQIRKDRQYAELENQYYMYSPFRGFLLSIKKPNEPFYISQINPYKINKIFVPFDTLRADWKYRYRRGPFVEIYFSNKNLRDEFSKNCPMYSLKCKNLNMDQGYYYNNLFVD